METPRNLNYALKAVEHRRRRATRVLVVGSLGTAAVGFGAATWLALVRLWIFGTAVLVLVGAPLFVVSALMTVQASRRQQLTPFELRIAWLLVITQGVLWAWVFVMFVRHLRTPFI
jgi:hypothetical protein